jgi:transcriptional regulator with XRE-family HTH domain
LPFILPVVKFNLYFSSFIKFDEVWQFKWLSMTSKKQPEPKDLEYAQALGTVLREERKLQSISIEVAAKALGITASYISQIETGKKNPTLSVIENYAIFLGLDMFELSLRIKIVRSPDKRSIERLIANLSGKIDVLADLRKKKV